MSDHAIELDRLFDLAGRICDEDASQDEFIELASVMLVDRAICRRYLGYCQMHSALRLELRAHRAAQAVFEQAGIRPTAAGSSEFNVVKVAPPDSVAPTFLSTALHGTIVFFSQELPFSLLIATVLTSLGLWIASLVYVSSPEKIAHHSFSLPAKSSVDPTLEVVGKITGMVDCKWADQNTETFNGANVLLGRKFALTSGLMEITYGTRAKVILQGPVTYKVESNGGYLSVGKLTGKLEKKEEHVASSNLQSLIPNPFVIRTPTAVVTDLGTEFGIEVDKAGITETHVFLGKVRLEGRGQASRVSGQTLLAGQAVRLDPRAAATVVFESDTKHFVRHMLAPKTTAILPELIGQLDYSDTWTANSSTRAGSYVFLTDPESLRVEQCHGNPLRSWVFSTPSALTVWPIWPGHEVQGSPSGFTETGFNGICYLGFEYGLRDDFVVQFDTVQTDDRINITIGDAPATIASAQSLSVFFRAAGGPLPEIGLYTSLRGEADTGFHTGIHAPYQWHNYAVRFDLPKRRLTVWVDRECRGAIDLTGITLGMEKKSNATWASLPWTGKCVTVGGSSGDHGGRVWTDNFRVGTPQVLGTSPPADLPVKPKED